MTAKYLPDYTKLRALAPEYLAGCRTDTINLRNADDLWWLLQESRAANLTELEVFAEQTLKSFLELQLRVWLEQARLRAEFSPQS